MNAREYQNKVAAIFRNIFDDNLVKTEWDSVKFDGHFSNHKSIYAPRHDIAVGPFNRWLPDLDIGDDQTESMKSHPFTKKLIEDELGRRGDLKNVWNSFSRCYLAIEIEFSGTSKHILGSIVNASVSGSIGIVIANHDNIEKAVRTSNYIRRLEGMELLRSNDLQNLIIFEDEQFLKFLSNF